MKHTGKILFGVLSTSALVGTGFAAWIVNNGFTDTKTVVVDSSVDTDVENKYSSVVDLTVVETDNSLKFASKENGEDLTLTYNLKANEAAYTTDFSLVTNEYIPDVTVSLAVTSKTSSKADIKTEVEKYLVLPETQTIAYDTWLQEKYKTDGYPLNINFNWNTDDGTNPQDWVINSGKSPEEQRDYFTNLANTLKDATFTFTFKIGRIVEMTTFTVDENLVNGKLTFKDSSGNTLNPGTSYRTGTEVEVVPEANPYYKVDKVLVDEVEVTANEEGKYVFTLDKATTVSATFVNKVNTVTLKYEKTQGEVKLTNALGEDLVGTTLNANDTFKVVATPNENYVLKGVVVTQGEETLTDVEGVYTVLDNEDGVNVTVTFEANTVTVEKTYSHVFASGEISSKEESVELDGITWNHPSAEYIGFDTNNGRGAQIGSSGNPASKYYFSTTLPEGVMVNKVVLVLSTGGAATYRVVTGTYDSGSKDISKTNNQEYVEEITGSSTDLTIYMNASSKAMYIKSMTIEFSVPTDVEFLPNL